MRAAVSLDLKCHVTGRPTSKVSSMQRVDSSYGCREGGTLDVDVSLETTRRNNSMVTIKQPIRTSTDDVTSCLTVCQRLLYLSRVPVHVDVNHSSMFVALLDDIMLDVHLPTRSLLTERHTCVHTSNAAWQLGTTLNLQHINSILEKQR